MILDRFSFAPFATLPLRHHPFRYRARPLHQLAVGHLFAPGNNGHPVRLSSRGVDHCLNDPAIHRSPENPPRILAHSGFLQAIWKREDFLGEEAPRGLL